MTQERYAICAKAGGIGRLTVPKLGVGRKEYRLSLLRQQVETEVKDNSKESFSAFLSDGCVSLVGSASSVPIKILKDTAAFNSYIMSTVLPFSQESDIGDYVII